MARAKAAMPRFEKGEVAAVFASYPEPVRKKLSALRQLIYDVAAKTEGVGRLEETLKWGQPSYLTPETKSGTTIRIDALQTDPGVFAMYVHCQTSLVSTYREKFPELNYEGDRAILFETKRALPKRALKECIALALTYHRDRCGPRKRS